MRKLMLAIGLAVVAAVAEAKSPPAGQGWYPNTGYVTGNGDIAFDPSADTSTWEYAWQPTVATTIYPTAQVLSNARALCIHNRTSGTCYWEPANGNIDPSTVTSSGAMGEQFQAGDRLCFDVKTARFLSGSGIACTAAATSTAPVMVRQWR